MATKQARITLSIGRSSEGPRSTGDINIIGLGFAFYQLWLYMAIFSAPKAFDMSAFASSPFSFPDHWHALLVYFFLASSSILLIAFSLFSNRLLPFFYSKTCVGASCISMFIGTALLFLAFAGEAVVIAASIFMGIGTAFIVVQFGLIFSKFEFATCVLNAGLAFAIGFIGADALVNWIPSPISGAFACLMPILLFILLFKNRPDSRTETAGEIPLSYVKPYITRLALSMVFLGIVIGALRVVCGDKLLSSGIISMELVLGVGCMTSVAVLVLAIALSKRTELWDSLLRNISPAIMIGIAGISLLAGDLKMFATFFTVIGFACLASITWILLASFARNLNGSYVFVFGLGYGIVQASSILGAIIANYFSSQGQFITAPSIENAINIAGFTSELGLSDLAIVLMLAFTAGYALTPRYRELKSILASLMIALSEESYEATNSKTPGPRSANETKDSIGAGVVESMDAPSMQPQDSKGAENAALPNNQSPKEEIRDKKGSFTRRCEEISEKYSLSAREKEVFFLLAKGHNAAYLTDKLCISRSTAKTHINHIYKKLDIHTQQELLNMVEDRQRGPVLANVDRATLQEALRRAKEEGPLESNPSELVEHIRRDIR